jgi:3-oxoacyl-[acyl-carrier protein] reductase
LGLASARALAAEGARVAMAARTTSSLTREAEALARLGKTETLPLTMDLRDPSSISRGVDEVIRRWGGVDILITNTSGPTAGEFVTISRESWQAALIAKTSSVELAHNNILVNTLFAGLTDTDRMVSQSPE